MELVIDTNIVFFAIVKNSISRIKLVPKEYIAPFLALCLDKGIPLWSNDKPLKEKQSIVKVLSTSELFNII
jgi:predicted nucleic acid-binding protein